MPGSPSILVALLNSEEALASDAAWSTFLEEYSPLLLSVAQDMASGQDEAMDHYAFVADRLRDHDFRRLRGYATNGAAGFNTWLAVIAKRLCIDNHRRRVGRPQSTSERTAREEAEWEARRNLADLVASDVNVVTIVDDRAASPEDELWASERSALLASAISALDERDQLLLTLRFEDGFGLEEIARTLGMSTRFHVHRRLKRLLGLLRDALRRQGVDEL